MSNENTAINGVGSTGGYALFKHMFDEHGLTLLESELTEIISIVNASLEARLEWWMRKAEGIAKERGELFRAGEAMRAIVMCYAWDCDEVRAWDAAAQPIRDMLSSPNAEVSRGT